MLNDNVKLKLMRRIFESRVSNFWMFENLELCVSSILINFNFEFRLKVQVNLKFSTLRSRIEFAVCNGIEINQKDDL